MGNQTAYFERTGYKPEYHIGDRVFGHYNGIPFAGTVGNDRLVSPVTGPEITVHLDLPLYYQNQFYQFVIVKHNQVRILPEITDKK
jgi:hypothetical protein